MEFLNSQLPVGDLPKVEQTTLEPIERSYLRVLRWEWLIGSLLLGILAGLMLHLAKPLQHPLTISLIAGGWTLLVVTWLLLQEKSFSSKAYAIREHDVIYRSGWIIQKTHTCPFNRIQHSAVTIGPLEKQYGLASLVLYTAGSNEADVRIRGLKEEIAWELKEWITQKIAHEPGA